MTAARWKHKRRSLVYKLDIPEGCPSSSTTNLDEPVNSVTAPIENKLRRTRKWGGIVLPIAGAVMLVMWLRWLGRPWACESSSLCLWGTSSSENSLRFGDAYSLLHLSFGILAFFALQALTSDGRWRQSAMWCFGLITFLLWEAIENVPAVIALFNSPAGMASYTGDSILNAIGDVHFGAVGFLVAKHCAAQTAATLVILFDVATTILVGDGLLLGTLRIFGLF